MKFSTHRSFLHRMALSLICSLIAWPAFAAKPVLSVLCPQGTLDHKVISEFERTAKAHVRIDLAVSRAEFEQRLRTSAGNWDVIIADENQLVSFGLAKFIRPAKQTTLPDPVTKFPLQKRSRFNEDGLSYFPLMADPVGIVWLKGTRHSQEPLQWSWIADPTQNPLWRSRIFLPGDLRFQFRIASLASGEPLPTGNAASQGAALDWFRKAQIQLRRGGTQLPLELLSERVVAGVIWKSEYLRLRKIVSNLEFGIPAKGTLFERFGAAVAADTTKEDLANEFIAHLKRNRNDLALFAGLVPLSNTDESAFQNWSLFEDNYPLSRELESELKKAQTGNK